MASRIPDETIHVFARTINQEAVKYGFNQIDIVRLINALMDTAAQGNDSAEDPNAEDEAPLEATRQSVNEFPLRSSRLRIRAALSSADSALFQRWLEDDYGRHSLLSCATAHHLDVAALLGSQQHEVGVIELHDGTPIG